MAQPFFLILYLVMAGGYAAALVGEPALREPAPLAGLAALFLVHGGLYWISERYAGDRRWRLAYFAVQVAVIFAIGLMLPGHWIVIALTMALSGQAAGAFWPRVWLAALVVLLCFALLAANLILSWGARATAEMMPILALIVAFVTVYVTLFGRQARARQEAQELLRELEAAHRQLQAYADRVEELTISRERERMARELHDTLAQGLAGLILQLEAADSHLEQGDPARAQQVVEQAMRRARTTLHEARRAVQALRPAVLEERSLVDALGREVDRFAEETGVRPVLDLEGGPVKVAPPTAQGVLRIVQESLSNVARHADANNVVVRLSAGANGIHVIVQDDGVGFSPAEASGRRGCFGLTGMRERAKRLGGTLWIESEPDRGTTVELAIESPP